MKCSSCQQEDWIEGELVDARSSRLSFKPENSKTFVFSYPAARAKACRVCGCISLSTDLVKLQSILKS